MYTELSDMAAMAFMVYDFAYIVDAARKARREGKDFVGLDVDFETDKSVTKSGVKDASLARSFTPAEIKKLIQDNAEILADYDDGFKGRKLKELFAQLDQIQARADASGVTRPLVLEEFDDKYQKRECVYGITRDSINKRITIVFRGTENKLAFGNNWKSNASIAKKRVDLPQTLQGKVDLKRLRFHSGFYNYIFRETKDTTDAVGTRKYDQIMGDLKALLAKYPGYKVYTTGHSLGAALSSVAAIHFACEPGLPKPISNINFASPRMGAYDVFEASQFLEKTKQLRVLRSVNENDSVTTVPSVGYYHIGFQVTAYADGWFRKAGPPDVIYRNVNDGLFTKWKKSWSNSIVPNLNLGYDHSDYIERIEAAKEELEKYSLNDFYLDEDVVGYKLE